MITCNYKTCTDKDVISSNHNTVTKNLLLLLDSSDL